MYLSVFLQKLERRPIALKNINWLKQHKARALQIMTISYMSSEEEEEEECESQTRRLVKRLPRIRPVAIKVKKHLDEDYITLHYSQSPKTASGQSWGYWQHNQQTITWFAGWPWPRVGYIATIIVYGHAYAIILFGKFIQTCNTMLSFVFLIRVPCKYFTTLLQ